ncbi:MAG: helix-turn-helix domain-containing protein [Trinickia sp.]
MADAGFQTSRTPPTRVFELRNQVYRISTMLGASITERGVVHMVGRYVLHSLDPSPSSPPGETEWRQLTLPLGAC